jgi:prevent-host-death family protein
MSTHSVAEATSELGELIDRVLGGEEVVITRDGEPVVELRPVVGKPATVPEKRLTAADIEGVAARRVGLRLPAEDAGTLVSRMRDEGEH